MERDGRNVKETTGVVGEIISVTNKQTFKTLQRSNLHVLTKVKIGLAFSLNKPLQYWWWVMIRMQSLMILILCFRTYLHV